MCSRLDMLLETLLTNLGDRWASLALLYKSSLSLACDAARLALGLWVDIVGIAGFIALRASASGQQRSMVHVLA